MTIADAQTILTSMLQLIGGGIVTLGEKIGQGLTQMLSSLMLVTSEGVTSLSVFGIFVCIFAGISLAIGFTKLVVHWVTSFGASRGM